MPEIPTTIAELVELVDGIQFVHHPSAIIVTPDEFAAIKRVSVPPQPTFAGLPPFVLGTPLIIDYGDHELLPGQVRLSDCLAGGRP